MVQTSNVVLELELWWGDTPLEVQHHGLQEIVTVGAGGHIAVGGGLTPAQTLFDWEGRQLRLHVLPGISGTVYSAAGEQPLTLLDDVVELDPRDTGTLVFHNLTVVWRMVRRMPRPVSPRFSNVDVGWLNTLLPTVMAGAAFVATLMLYPTNALSVEDPLPEAARTFHSAIINPPPKQKSAFLLGMEHRHPSRKRNPAPAPVPASPKPARAGARVVDPNQRARDVAAATLAVEKMFGGVGTGAVFSSSESGSLTALMGQITGTQVGDAHGALAVDLRGTGPGGSAAVGTLYSSGPIRTRGKRSEPAYGTAGGPLGTPPEHTIALEERPPTIIGSLDRDVIRRVIRDHQSQIRYCYELELTRTPGLAGKVQLHFVINAEGTVHAATTEDSTVGSKPLEHCVASKARSWVFPPPKGGGVVVVTYPFIFKQGG